MKSKHLIAAGLCCLLLTACSDLSLTGSDILSPPAAQGDRSGLRELITQSVGEDYMPVYPAAGEYQNAVIERDIDGDETDEAIVLCRGRDGDVSVLVFVSDGSSYSSAGKASIHASRIDRVEFADLDADGTQELILLYPDSASEQDSLTVVSTTEPVVQADMPASCRSCIISDLDGDGAQDVLLLSLSSPIGSAAATLLGYDHGALSVRTSCEMDSLITGYESITCGMVSEGVSGVFVDGYNASGETTTQVLYYDPERGSLFNPLFIYVGYESTRRTEHISCGDIDTDGLVEFPVCSLCDCGEKEPPETVCRRLTWNNYRTADMELISKKTAVLCGDQGFLFNIDDARVGTVTARCTDPDTVALYAWEFSGAEMRCTDLLVTLHRYAKERYDSSGGAGTLLASTDDSVYTYELNPTAGAHAYTGDEVKNSFTPME